ncbi:MAG: hypothetical protein ABIA91_02790, partial [Patescibacteria group bacterium]
QFSPVFNEFDLMNIEKFNTYIRMMISNQAARPFNMATLAPVKGDLENMNKVAEASRKKYGIPKDDVEKDILKRSKIGEMGKEDSKEL